MRGPQNLAQENCGTRTPLKRNFQALPEIPPPRKSPIIMEPTCMPGREPVFSLPLDNHHLRQRAHRAKVQPREARSCPAAEPGHIYAPRFVGGGRRHHPPGETERQTPRAPQPQTHTSFPCQELRQYSADEDLSEMSWTLGFLVPDTRIRHQIILVRVQGPTTRLGSGRERCSFMYVCVCLCVCVCICMCCPHLCLPWRPLSSAQFSPAAAAAAREISPSPKPLWTPARRRPPAVSEGSQLPSGPRC